MKSLVDEGDAGQECRQVWISRSWSKLKIRDALPFLKLCVSQSGLFLDRMTTLQPHGGIWPSLSEKRQSIRILKSCTKDILVITLYRAWIYLVQICALQCVPHSATCLQEMLCLPLSNHNYVTLFNINIFYLVRMEGRERISKGSWLHHTCEVVLSIGCLKHPTGTIASFFSSIKCYP